MFYMPAYFGGVYFNEIKWFATLNALITLICGMAANVGGGMICDHFEQKYSNPRVISYFCMISGLLGIPFITICTLCQHEFQFSIGMLAVAYLISEGWFAVSLTMILNTISPENKGFAVSVLLFFFNISGTVGTALFGYLENIYDAKLHP